VSAPPGEVLGLAPVPAPQSEHAMAHAGSAPTKTRALGAFAATLRYADLPVEVATYAKRALVDWTAATLGGVGEPSANRLRQVAAAMGGAGPATVIGTSLVTSPTFAALANAYTSHLLDFDDCYNPVETTIHLSSCLWGAILAVGQARALSGRDVLTAYLAGFEVGARVARAAGPTHYQSAWHVTGVCGHVAAAAAAASALKLSPGAAAHALGTAATQGAGIREVYGSDTKALHPAKAAMDGLLSALLAEQGFTSTATAVEGERGLLAAVSKAPTPELLTDGLGSTWEILENGNKLYPSASLTHAPIEAAIQAASSGKLDPAEIEAVSVRVHPFTAAVTALAQPGDGQAARFSTPHCVAVPLARGALTLADFEQATIDDPAIRRLRGVIELVADPQMDRRGCLLSVLTRPGERMTVEIERNRGTPAMPLTSAELSAKFMTLSQQVLDGRRSREALDLMWALEDITDIGDVMTLFATSR
jgi:2-methylcitrate dehydratase PrpD